MCWLHRERSSAGRSRMPVIIVGGTRESNLLRFCLGQQVAVVNKNTGVVIGRRKLFVVSKCSLEVLDCLVQIAFEGMDAAQCVITERSVWVGADCLCEMFSSARICTLFIVDHAQVVVGRIKLTMVLGS